MKLILNFKNFDSNDLTTLDTDLNQCKDIQFEKLEQNGFNLEHDIFIIISSGIKLFIPILIKFIEKSNLDNNNNKCLEINYTDGEKTEEIKLTGYNVKDCTKILESIYK